MNGWYTWGVWTCTYLAQHPGTPVDKNLAATVASQSGFTPAGGDAIVAASVRELCTTYGQYTTAFDERVRQGQNSLADLLGGVPPEVQTGVLGKTVCDYWERGDATLSTRLTQSPPLLPQPQSTPAVTYSLQLEKKVVVAVAGAVCPALDPPAYWLSR